MTLTFTGGCFCRAITYSAALKQPGPLAGTYCHCDDCRLTSGFYCAFLASIPRAALKLNGPALVEYKSSDVGTRFFCGKCGTSILFNDAREPEDAIVLYAAAIDVPAGTPRGLRAFVEPKKHIYLDSTHGGGISVIMDDGLPRFAKFSTGARWTMPQEKLKVPEAGDALKGSCHCKGVVVKILRPPEDYAQDDVLRHWVKIGRRFAATNCFCDDCRLASGTPFWSWCFIPTKQLDWQSDSSLRAYDSNVEKGIKRRFCGVCGCHIAYHIRNNMWDMALAIFDQPDAEAWVAGKPSPHGEDPADELLSDYLQSWIGDPRPVSYLDDGVKYNPELVEEVKRGMANSQRF